MPVSIDNYLKNLASGYYLKSDSNEVKKIETSLNFLRSNLNKELGILTRRILVFGSWDRDTILPRKFDSKSDIDLMIVFKHTEYERTPETYRLWLLNFAKKYYPTSTVNKSFPTVTVSLNHIKYDLVPAKEEEYPFLWMPNELYIPDSSGGWRSTDPSDVKMKLADANKKYKYVVKPIIRLLKAWNCGSGYPYDSYLLEMEVAGMNFYNDNVQTGFFYAVSKLSAGYFEPQIKKDKITSLKYNVGKVKEALDNNDSIKAKQWLHRVLPY